MKKRIQHPAISEQKTAHGSYWFVRVFEPVIRRGGRVEEVRKKHNLGPSSGPDAIGRREAELRRDRILARVNGLTRPKHKEGQEPLGDYILFERLVEMFREGHLPNVGHATRLKYNHLLDKHLLPRWSGERLAGIRHQDVQVWMNGLKLAHSSKLTVKGLLGKLFEYAASSELYLGRNPTHKINAGRKGAGARSKEILDPETTAAVIARVEPWKRLIIETAVVNGMRVSEVLALRWNVVNRVTGVFRIEQRYYRGDIDQVKTDASERKGFLPPELLERYIELWIKNGRPKGSEFVFDRGDGSGEPPRDETVREALKEAAAELGVDFVGFGMHTLRRANITWRQSHGGATSIEASKMAGHADVRMTAHYTDTRSGEQRMKETTQAVSNLLIMPKKKGAA